MILSETKAKGMKISFLKHYENDLSILSCHLYGHLTLFHSLLIANQNDHTQVPTYYLSNIFFCLLGINFTVKLVLRGHSKRGPKLVFKTDYSLMQVKSFEECSKRACCNTFDLHEATICL